MRKQIIQALKGESAKAETNLLDRFLESNTNIHGCCPKKIENTNIRGLVDILQIARMAHSIDENSQLFNHAFDAWC